MFSAAAMPIRCAATVAAVRPRAAVSMRPYLSVPASYSTSVTRPSQLLKLSAAASARYSASAATRCPSPITARLVSSSSSIRAATTAANSSSASAHASAANAADTLTWNRFLALRKTRRRLSLVCSVAAAIASTAVGINILLASDIDSLGAQTFGLDPIIVTGMGTVACGCIGWLLGPAIGDGLFRIAYRRIGKQIVEVSLSRACL